MVTTVPTAGRQGIKVVNILVLGDTHGNTNAAVQAVKYARDHDTKLIVQVGDFGLWTHFQDGIKFVDTLNESLRHDGTNMYVIGGNHENWDHWNWHIGHGPRDYHGFTYLRSHIRIAPKVHYWNWNGKVCLGIGGAVSIDKEMRLANESSTFAGAAKKGQGHLDGQQLLWWKDEQLTDKDLELVTDKKVDYVFSHDCSNSTPFRDRLKPDFESMMHRQRIDKALRKSRPDFHWHGHMHTKYNWQNLTGDDHYTQTYGLECDGDWDNMGILELETGEFKFRSDMDRER